MTARTINKQTPPPAFRVFISSTFSDMKQYREAIQTAVNRADCVAYGMERFGAETIPPLDVCFEELKKSQIYICALGMRYGSIDSKTGKSYTQLEFEKARELGKPTLVFIIDENNVSFKISEIDTDSSAQKLRDFKENIKLSKEVTCAFFDSAMALQEVAYRSIEVEKKRQGSIDNQEKAISDVRYEERLVEEQRRREEDKQYMEEKNRISEEPYLVFKSSKIVPPPTSGQIVICMEFLNKGRGSAYDIVPDTKCTVQTSTMEEFELYRFGAVMDPIAMVGEVFVVNWSYISEEKLMFRMTPTIKFRDASGRLYKQTYCIDIVDKNGDANIINYAQPELIEE